MKHTISGNKHLGEEGSALRALSDFYHAFNMQDFSLMQSNWLQGSHASMSNPLGGIKRGWNEIQEVYTKIFNGPAKVYVEYYDYSIDETENMFVAVGRERGFVEVNGIKVDLAIRTSRIYTRENAQWKQVHHHGSIDQPGLLSEYQSVVLNGTACKKEDCYVD